jgi:hypothetical protein
MNVHLQLAISHSPASDSTSPHVTLTLQTVHSPFAQGFSATNTKDEEVCLSTVHSLALHATVTGGGASGPSCTQATCGVTAMKNSPLAPRIADPTARALPGRMLTAPAATVPLTMIDSYGTAREIALPYAR